MASACASLGTMARNVRMRTTLRATPMWRFELVANCSRDGWVEVGLAIHIYGALGLFIFMVWFILKFAYNAKQGRLRLNLSLVAQICSFLGCALRFVYFVYPNTGIMRTYNIDEEERLTRVFLGAALSSLAPALWMAGCGLIAGFWIDALARKLRPKMAKTARITFIVLAALLSLAVAGVVYALLVELLAGSIIALVPVLVNVVALLVAAIMLSCWSEKGLSDVSKDKKRYSARLIGSCSGFWLGYTLWLIIFTVSTSDQNTFGFLYLVTLFFMIVCEHGVVLTTLLLIDRRGGPWRLSRALCGDDEAMSSSQTLSTHSDSAHTNTGSHASHTSSLSD